MAKGFDVKIVSQEDGYVGAPSCVDGLPSSSRIRIVDNIVMNKAGCMDGFYQGGHQDIFFTLVPNQLGTEQKKSWSNPLSGALEKIGCDFRDEPVRRIREDLELFLYFIQVIQYTAVHSIQAQVAFDPRFHGLFHGFFHCILIYLFSAFRAACLDHS
jgi:hypothetical protein